MAFLRQRVGCVQRIPDSEVPSKRAPASPRPRPGPPGTSPTSRVSAPGTRPGTRPRCPLLACVRIQGCAVLPDAPQGRGRGKWRDPGGQGKARVAVGKTGGDRARGKIKQASKSWGQRGIECREGQLPAYVLGILTVTNSSSQVRGQKERAGTPLSPMTFIQNSSLGVEAFLLLGSISYLRWITGT